MLSELTTDAKPNPPRIPTPDKKEEQSSTHNQEENVKRTNFKSKPKNKYGLFNN